MRIEVWADVVCPWCAIGHHRLSRALRESGVQAEVVHRAFQLDPSRTVAQPSRDALRHKYGPRGDARMRHVRELAAAEGLVLRTEEAVSANTFDAHRLVAFAQAEGKGQAMLERLFRGHFEESLDVSDHGTLARMAGEAGLPAEETGRVLEGDAFAAEVRADVAAARHLRVSGVPFFLFDGRLGLSGAQPVDVFRQALAEAARTEAADGPAA